MDIKEKFPVPENREVGIYEPKQPFPIEKTNEIKIMFPVPGFSEVRNRDYKKNKEKKIREQQQEPSAPEPGSPSAAPVVVSFDQLILEKQLQEQIGLYEQKIRSIA